PSTGAWQMVCELADEATVKACSPDFSALALATDLGVCITAEGSDTDFVSRFFIPQLGINEDPVTGSAHCQLVPFWAARLSKTSLRARQLSARGGE
ncbi:MAG: PhzF family phenazine biosynthesis protein, partial [Halieaceae bacterium]